MYKLNSEVRNLILIFELLNVNCFHIKNDRPYSVLWQTNQFEEEVAVHNHLRSVKGSTIWNQIPTVAGLWLFILACSLLQCRANASYVYVYGLRVHTFNVHIICYYQHYQKAYIYVLLAETWELSMTVRQKWALIIIRTFFQTIQAVGIRLALNVRSEDGMFQTC